MSQQVYNTLEDLQARKNELKNEIQDGNEHIATIWHELVAPKKSNSKGELVANLISNGITAIDGFLLVHKLIKSYGFLFTRRKGKK